MSRTLSLVFAAAAIALAPLALAAAPAGNFWLTPTIKGAGPIHPLPNAALQPDKNAVYKVVFNLTGAASSASTLNPGLDHVARAVNLFVAAGVPLDHLKFAVVIHGQATPIVMNDAAYQKKLGTANPNLALMTKLRQAGVAIYVCGQAVAENDIPYSDVASQVTLSLSALTDLVILQQQGYVLEPL